MHKTLFISDLHLTESEPKTTETFLHFAATIDSSVQALYILGDLFEYWIGDDDLNEPFNQIIINALATVSAKGTALFFMHGNRDFLLGQAFGTACQGILLADPTLINLYGTPTLLMHGDTLCTEDIDYIHFRKTVRNQAWQENFLAKPLTERRAVVEDLRRQSEQAKRLKPMEITDVALSTVETTLRSHAYPLLIHGHTHRPAHHVHTVDGRICERWVLTDWHAERGGYLEITSTGRQAHSI